MSGAVLEARDLRKYYPATRGLLLRRRIGWIKAVDGVTFALPEHQTLSIVGESGCGKTTTAKMLLGLELPTGGEVLFRGTSIYGTSGRVRRDYRRAVHAVFQDPWGSLDPRMRVGPIVAEPLEIQTRLSPKEVRARVEELLVEVGLQPRHAELYPHEFSGGQRQRIALARALALNPAVVILDEPVSALDVSIRAQIINLLKNLQDRHGLSYVLIAHNLATVRYLSDSVVVMYLGRVVERGPSERVFTEPLHPYTQVLLRASLPSHPKHRRELARVPGEVPSPLAPPPGCAFHTRCPLAMDVCSTTTPELAEVRPGHWAACHLHTDAAERRVPGPVALNGTTARER